MDARTILRAGYKTVNSLLGLVNLRLIKANEALAFDMALARLKSVAFDPSVVIDIGVAYGTPDLYSAFNKAKYYLIDPLPQSMPYMQQWAKKLDAQIMNFALGREENALEIDVRPYIGGSTFYQEIAGAPSLGKIKVPIKRFDAVFTSSNLLKPVLAKIDVQGAELDVLAGMGELINEIDIFIIEVSAIVTLSGGAAHMYDVIDYLKHKGFVLYDICGIARRPLDDAMAQLDLIFCRVDSKFLSKKIWS
jgi:FkbM family methyltransferase